ncbi:MAG: hypothetical protein ACC654_00950 [Acidimicrobiia bacterium]
MTDRHTPDETTETDELLDALQSADPAEAPDIAESLAETLAADLAATEPLPRDRAGESS